jgi:hypothetical protein
MCVCVCVCYVNSISDLVINLQSMVSQFEVAIERAELSEKSVDSVLRVMEPVARHIATRGGIHGNTSSIHGDHGNGNGHTKFSYEEQDHSEEFFLPYVWRVIWQHQPLPFPADGIVLFATTHDTNNNTTPTAAAASSPTSLSTNDDSSPNGSTTDVYDPNYIADGHHHSNNHTTHTPIEYDTKRSSSFSSSSLRAPYVTTAASSSSALPYPTPPASPGYSPTSFARHLPNLTVAPIGSVAIPIHPTSISSTPSASSSSRLAV